MVEISELWDVGEEIGRSAPNLGKTSTARVMQALLKCDGKLVSSIVFGENSFPDSSRSVVYRIALPLCRKEKFEELCGYILTRPQIINSAWRCPMNVGANGPMFDANGASNAY